MKVGKVASKTGPNGELLLERACFSHGSRRFRGKAAGNGHSGDELTPFGGIWRAAWARGPQALPVEPFDPRAAITAIMQI